MSLTCHGGGHPHSDPGLGRRARVWCPGPSGRWDGYQISHSASRGAETWPENKGNGTPEYRWSPRMVIKTWDHFKHLRFGPELEWREPWVRRVSPGSASGKSMWFGEPYFCLPSQDTLPRSHLRREHSLLWVMARGSGLTSPSPG